MGTNELGIPQVPSIALRFTNLMRRWRAAQWSFNSDKTFGTALDEKWQKVIAPIWNKIRACALAGGVFILPYGELEEHLYKLSAKADEVIKAERDFDDSSKRIVLDETIISLQDLTKTADDFRVLALELVSILDEMVPEKRIVSKDIVCQHAAELVSILQRIMHISGKVPDTLEGDEFKKWVGLFKSIKIQKQPSDGERTFAATLEIDSDLLDLHGQITITERTTISNLELKENVI